MPITCEFGPQDLRAIVPCLFSVSKDLEGELIPLGAEKDECLRLECQTLTTFHAVRGKLTAQDCDSERTRGLDGPFIVESLTTIFEQADPFGRGVHAGDFRWTHPDLFITGRLQGITNNGLLRKPLAQPCEECRNPGKMTGRLCGWVESFSETELSGALVTAVYRFEYEPNDEGGAGRLVGIIEGAIVQECPPG